MEPTTGQRKSIFLTDQPAAPNTPRTAGGGEGMDRTVKKKTFTPKRIGLGVAILAFVGLVGWGLASTAGGSRLNVEREKITIAPVTYGTFQELVSVSGNLMPRTTIYLDAVEGGRVEEVFVREGATVEAGQPLLRLSNSNLQMSLLTNETNLAEQVSNLQNMRFQIEQNRLDVRQQLTQMDYEIQRLRREFQRNEDLLARDAISQQTFEETRDELGYWERRRDLTMQSYRSDSLSQELRVQQMESAVDRMRQNFGILQETLANLTVRAPAAGELTMLDAEVGELRSSGSRFGQIDVLDGGYKITAGVDEYYIDRVHRGQRARTLPIGGTEYELQVVRVYPEVRDGRFEIDLEFVGEEPEGLRRGRQVRFNLELSDAQEATLIPRGGFFNDTGGNWIFVVQGDEAIRRDIRIGRQNPSHYEVLEGLEPGEEAVTSSYQTFGDADRLVLK